MFSLAWAVPITLVVVIMVYARAQHYPYVDWDDPAYVVHSPLLDSAAAGDWMLILAEPTVGNYHPVTMASYALTERIASRSARAHHMVSVVLHAVNALLALFCMRALLGRTDWAFVAALLWALHPMRVESVAWVSARKDLLMLFFGMLALLAWLRWMASARWWWYVAALMGFVLACASKAMAVAFAPTMLLLAWWRGSRLLDQRIWLLLVPFGLIAFVAGVLAIDAQAEVGALNQLRLDSAEQIAVGFANLSFYLVHQILPMRLSVFYGYPAGVGLPAIYLLFALLALALLLVLVRLSRKGPQLVVVGCWFMVIHLAFVLQWLPVGEAVRADRYTYVAGLGLAMAIAACGQHLESRWPRTVWFGIFAALMGLSWLTSCRLPLWSAPERIWTEMIAHEPQRYWHLTDRAITFENQGRFELAAADHDRAVLRGGDDLKPVFARGMFRIRRKQYQGAMTDLLSVFQRKPAYPGLIANMLYVQLKLGRCDELLQNASAVLAQDPDQADVLNMRAYCLLDAGRPDEAVADIQRSLALRQDYPEVHFLNGWHAWLAGDTATACEALRLSSEVPMHDEDWAIERDRLQELACPSTRPVEKALR